MLAGLGRDGWDKEHKSCVGGPMRLDSKAVCMYLWEVRVLGAHVHHDTEKDTGWTQTTGGARMCCFSEDGVPRLL